MEADARQVEDLFDNDFEEAMKTIARNFLTDQSVIIWLKKMKHFHFTVTGKINQPQTREIKAGKSAIFHVENPEDESIIYKFASRLGKCLEHLEIKPAFYDLCFIQTSAGGFSLIYYTNTTQNQERLMKPGPVELNETFLTIDIAPDIVLEL